MLEYITIGLAWIAGITATMAFIYRKGKSAAMYSQCEKNIKNEIKELGNKVDTN